MYDTTVDLEAKHSSFSSHKNILLGVSTLTTTQVTIAKLNICLVLYRVILYSSLPLTRQELTDFTPGVSNLLASLAFPGPH